MTDISKLMNKYYKRVGQNSTAIENIRPAEKRSPEYNKQLKRTQYNRHRHLILDELLTEIPHHYTTSEIESIRYLIDRFNDNFKDFHRQSSNETIILAFMMIYWKQKNPKLKVSELPISRKYDLNKDKFELIQNRLIFQLMRTTELTYSQAKYVNHEYL
jgi:hypothetical protein